MNRSRILNAAGAIILAYERMWPRGTLSPRAAQRIARVLERRHGSKPGGWPFGEMNEYANRWPDGRTDEVIRVALTAHRTMMGQTTIGDR